MNISLLLGPQVGTRPLVYRLKYLQTRKKNKFVKFPKFFYIEILYCLLWWLDFASLRRQNLGKNSWSPLDQILDPLLKANRTVATIHMSGSASFAITIIYSLNFISDHVLQAASVSRINRRNFSSEVREVTVDLCEITEYRGVVFALLKM